MAEYVIGAKKRTPGHANRERRAGFVPAVLYGQGRNEAVAVTAAELERLLTSGGTHSVVQLHLEEGAPANVMIADVQRDPVRQEILHVDFHQIAMDEPIQAEVPVTITGEEEVHKRGGIIEHLLWQVEVQCLPGDLPEHLTVDISELEVGDALQASQVPLPRGVQLVTEATARVLTVTLPQRAPEEESVETEISEQAEPKE